MVRLSIALRAASVRGAQDLLDALRFVTSNTRLEPGCLASSSWRGPDDVNYIEEWRTEADMRRRVRSHAFMSLLAIVESAREPTVQFDFVASTRGLDYVTEMRDDAVR